MYYCEQYLLHLQVSACDPTQATFQTHQELSSSYFLSHRSLSRALFIYLDSVLCLFHTLGFFLVGLFHSSRCCSNWYQPDCDLVPHHPWVLFSVTPSHAVRWPQSPRLLLWQVRVYLYTYVIQGLQRSPPSLLLTPVEIDGPQS